MLKSAPTLALFSILYSLIAPVSSLHAEEHVFEANFDDPIYLAGSELPRGIGKLQYGRWGGSEKESGYSILVTDEKSFSGNQSLLLERTESPSDIDRPAKVWAGFRSDEVRVANALTFSCVFLVQHHSEGERGSLALTLTGASASALFSIEIDQDGGVGVHRAGSSEALGSIVADQWYLLEIIAPDPGEPGARAVVNLYTTKEAQRGELIGTVSTSEFPSEFVYAGFWISNTLSPSKVFFDDFQAVIQD